MQAQSHLMLDCEPDIFIFLILKYIYILCFIVFSFTGNTQAGVNVSECAAR